MFASPEFRNAVDANRMLDHDEVGDFRDYDLDDKIELQEQVETTLPDPTMSEEDLAWLDGMPDLHEPCDRMYPCGSCEGTLDGILDADGVCDGCGHHHFG